MKAFPEFFAKRPRLAVALAVLLAAAGICGMATVPVRLHPPVAEPTVTISCTYPGANSRELMNTVAGPIEDEINGVEGMLYMSSSCADSGAYSCTVTFDVGTDRDVALMKVQTRVQRATPLLPQEVKNAGLAVSAGTPEDFAILTLRSPGRRMSFRDISDYVHGVVQPAVLRVQGVGNATVRSDKVAMRIWLDARRMAAIGISADEVIGAIRRQNVQASIGTVGATPAGERQGRVISLIAKGRLGNVDDFGDIVVRTNPGGAMVRLGDVARIELGQQAYSYVSFHGDVPAVQVVISLFPGEDLKRTHERLEKTLKGLERDFPHDLTWELTHDATRFMYASLAEVARCLGWGFAIMLLAVAALLRDCRKAAVLAVMAALSVVPSFAAVAVAGESLNVLTLSAAFMAIGLAAADCVALLCGASAGTVAVSSAVVAAMFVPVGLVGGLTGVVYRQFAVVLASAALFSALVALSVGPAMRNWSARRGMVPFPAVILGRVASALARRRALLGAAIAFMAVASAAIARRVPSTLVPDEDTGYVNVNVETPECTRMSLTAETMRRAAGAIMSMEGVSSVLTLCGTSNTGGAGENQALAVVVLDDWSRRKSPGLDSREIMRRIVETNSVLPLAAFYPLPPATLPGLGGAVQLLLMSTADSDPIRLAREAHRIERLVGSSPLVERAVCGYTATTPHLRVNVDRAKCELLNVPLATLYATLQEQLGSLYVNDINLGTQVNRVTVEADWQDRSGKEAVGGLFVRSDTGAMVPIDALVTLEEELGPRVCYRYNKYVYCGVTIVPSDGISSREVIDETVRIVEGNLPSGFAYAWGNLTFHEMRGDGNGSLMALVAALAVYLVLVGRFNSWLRPFAVALPAVGVLFAAVCGLRALGVPMSLHAKMGLLLLAAVAVKGAMLLAESKEPLRASGALFAMAIGLALGALPFLLSCGAGRNALHTVGAAVCCGSVGLAFSVPVLAPGLLRSQSCR